MTKAQLLENLPRWLVASTHSHFETKIPQDKLKLFPEMYSKSEDERRIRDFAEFRFDGPNIRPKSPKRLDAYFEINLLIQSTMRDDNFHVPQVDIGLVLPAFTTIPIYKYGKGPLDDQSLIGCAKITQQGRQTEVFVAQFGEIDPQLKLFQATVEAAYLLELKHS